MSFAFKNADTTIVKKKFRPHVFPLINSSSTTKKVLIKKLMSSKNFSVFVSESVSSRNKINGYY